MPGGSERLTGDSEPLEYMYECPNCGARTVSARPPDAARNVTKSGLSNSGSV